ncbi:hypothetical protein RDI58_021848 [Solanum bulbocastanum]|jgi:hypothetical protein
MKFL